MRGLQRRLLLSLGERCDFFLEFLSGFADGALQKLLRQRAAAPVGARQRDAGSPGADALPGLFLFFLVRLTRGEECRECQQTDDLAIAHAAVRGKERTRLHLRAGDLRPARILVQRHQVRVVSQRRKIR